MAPGASEIQGRLILIRHGRCDDGGRFLGSRSDPPLHGAGLLQKEQLRCWFTALPEPGRPYRLFTSPLLRARETAEAFTGTGLIPTVIPALAEIDLGDWDGLTYEAVMAGWPREGREWFSDPFNNAPPGGEGGRDFQARVGEVFDSCADYLRGGSTVLAVTHAGVIRILLTLLLELPFGAQWRFSIQPGRRTTINFQEGYPIVEGVNQ